MRVHRKPWLLNLAEDKLKDQKSTFRLGTEQSAQAENSHASLNSKLLAYRRESAIRRPAFAKAYDELVERLNVIERGQVGPQLGDLMPGFDLPDETGRFVSLSSLLLSGPVVISINRGHW